jgi:hypothetical protein
VLKSVAFVIVSWRRPFDASSSEIVGFAMWSPSCRLSAIEPRCRVPDQPVC